MVEQWHTRMQTHTHKQTLNWRSCKHEMEKVKKSTMQAKHRMHHSPAVCDTKEEMTVTKFEGPDDAGWQSPEKNVSCQSAEDKTKQHKTKNAVVRTTTATIQHLLPLKWNTMDFRRDWNLNVLRNLPASPIDPIFLIYWSPLLIKFMPVSCFLADSWHQTLWWLQRFSVTFNLCNIQSMHLHYVFVVISLTRKGFVHTNQNIAWLILKNQVHTLPSRRILMGDHLTSLVEKLSQLCFLYGCIIPHHKWMMFGHACFEFFLPCGATSSHAKPSVTQNGHFRILLFSL